MSFSPFSDRRAVKTSQSHYAILVRRYDALWLRSFGRIKTEQLGLAGSQPVRHEPRPPPPLYTCLNVWNLEFKTSGLTQRQELQIRYHATKVSDKQASGVPKPIMEADLLNPHTCVPTDVRVKTVKVMTNRKPSKVKVIKHTFQT